MNETDVSKQSNQCCIQIDMALKTHRTWSLMCVCFKFYCCITWQPCSHSKTVCVCYSSFLAFSFSCPPKATHSSGTHLKSTKKEMLSFQKCRMFLNITLFSSGLFCYPKGVMWYVDLMLLCCVCGSLLMLAWGAVPRGAWGDVSHPLVKNKTCPPIN